MQQHTGKAGSIFLGKYYSFLGGVRGEWEDGRTRFQFSQVSEGRIFPQAMYAGCADLSRYTCTFTPLQCLSAGIFRGFFPRRNCGSLKTLFDAISQEMMVKHYLVLFLLCRKVANTERFRLTQ